MNRILPVLATALMVGSLVAGCLSGDDDVGPVDAGNVPPMLAGGYHATVETSVGSFRVELWEDRAPLSVANFLQYAEDGHFDGTVFHRVMKGFVIQGGGFEAPFSASSPPRPTGAPIPVETFPSMTHDVGTLGMARTNDPNSGTSQWFVNTGRNTALDAGYTVFGRVVDGMDTVRAIENVPTTTKGSYENVPVEDVVITRVTVERPDTPAEPALVMYRSAYGVTPGRSVSMPIFVKNVGGERLEVELTGSGPEGTTVTFPHAPGLLSAGQAGIVVAEVAVPSAFMGGEVSFTATTGDRSDAVTVALTPLQRSPREAGGENPKARVHYIGLYDNGVTFDTTAIGFAERGFPMPVGFTEHSDPLKVWLGQADPADGYTPVIPGFAEGVKGLQPGETRAVRLTPEEGYGDGKYRIFEVHLVALD